MDCTLIVGLGNPGRPYQHTRHNVGYDVLDILYDRLQDPTIEKFRKSSARKGLLNGQRVILLKPLTYMNLSGEAVREAVNFYKLDPAYQVLVICDDVDLPVGTLRMRKKGSAGGHNGLKNIILHLGREDFPRIRLGVGDRPDRETDLANHVLGHFDKEDARIMEEAMEKAADAAECFLTDGADLAMNRYNTVKKRKKAETEIPETERPDPEKPVTADNSIAETHPI